MCPVEAGRIGNILTGGDWGSKRKGGYGEGNNYVNRNDQIRECYKHEM